MEKVYKKGKLQTFILPKVGYQIIACFGYVCTYPNNSNYMYKILSISFLLFLVIPLAAQINESEPNNENATADELPMNTSVSGQICIWDDPDYYQIILPEDGILQFTTTVAGEGDNPSTGLGFTLFNNNNPWNTYTPEPGEFGISLSEVNGWCCLLKDTFYIQVYSGYVYPYCYNYTLSWEIISAPYSDDEEPNSIFQDALPLEYNTSVEGHLAFINHPQGNAFETGDFYSFTPPINGTLRLFIESQAQSTGSNNVTVYIHDSNGSGWYNQTVPVGIYPAVHSDTLIWECVANAPLFFSMNTTNYFDRGYSYRIRYDMSPHTFSNDIEPNNYFESAQVVDPSLPIEGNQLHGNSYYWGGTQEDIYKFELPEDGAFKIKVYSETLTDDNTGGNVIQLYDVNTNPIGSPFTAPIGLYGVPEVDSVSFASIPAGTYYIKTYSSYVYATCRSYRLELTYVESPESTLEIQKNNVRLYPNPSIGTINLDTRKMSGQAQIVITDFLGKIVFNQLSVLGNIANIQLNEMAQGYYMLHIKNDDNDVRIKFMISH